MFKRIICIVSALSIVMCGCGTRTVYLTEVSENKEDKTIVVESEEEEKEEKLFDKDVDIVLCSVLVGEETIYDYVENLKVENPDCIYNVYDESHYSQTIKESERKEMVEKIKNKEYIDEAFKELFTEEKYNGAYLSIEYDNRMENVTFYVDRVKFEDLGLFNFLTPYIIGKTLSDTIQAYNLVAVEDRSFRLLIIDNETKETIYDSDEE